MSQVPRRSNTPSSQGDAYEETLREDYAKGNRAVEEVREAGPGKIRAARKAHHGKSVNSDGSPYLQPVKKGRTSGGSN